MRRPSPLAAVAAGVTLLATGAAVARAQDSSRCSRVDLRFEGATYYQAPDVGRGRPLLGLPLGGGALTGGCGPIVVFRAKRVSPGVGVLAGDPPRIYVATGFLEPLSAHPLHLWLHRRGTPRRPAACNGARTTVTGAASRDFRRDRPLRVRGTEVIVHNRTTTAGISVGGVPRIGRGQRIAVTGPACRGRRAVAASVIRAAG